MLDLVAGRVDGYISDIPALLYYVKDKPDLKVVERIPTGEKYSIMWRPYYEKWPMMTTSELDPALVDLVPDLKRLVPPARLFDKTTYSPWTSGRLHTALLHQGIGTLVVTGGETDICVLATTLGAVDLGYKVVLLKDALWSTTDQTHDASLQLLGNRFSVQVEVINTEEWLSSL